MQFRNKIGRDVFDHKYKYREGGCGTWDELSETLVDRICSKYMLKKDILDLKKYISNMKFIPGGRYLYYAGRNAKFINNCFAFIPEDSREGWADLGHKHFMALMSGGGCGSFYGNIRPKGRSISRTGGESSGPVPLMMSMNEIGRHVKQGGSRRSALWAGLPWNHDDIEEFLTIKDWSEDIIKLKEKDFNYPAPLDMTNISVCYDTKWLESDDDDIFNKNVYKACKTSEPGFAFNFYENHCDVARNAPVSGDTNVLTISGYKKINQIVGKKTKVWTGKQYAETTFKKTSENSEILNVTMTGGRVIKAEPTHPFMVEKWKGKGINRRKLISIDRVEAKNLVCGDVIHVSLPEVSEPEFSKFNYTLGFAYGDGNFGEDGGSISLCCDEKKKLIDYFDKSIFSSVNMDDGRGYIRAYTKKSFSYEDNENKILRLKSEYPLIDTKNAPSFIAGLFDSDGNFLEQSHSIRLSSVYVDFLNNVRRSLESIGILSTVHKGSNGSFKGTPTFNLLIMADYVSEFKRTVPTKRLFIADHKSYRESKIKVLSVEQGEREDVFCCDVGVAEHTFMAEGVIISNCCEVTSMYDSDVCNLGSVNMSRIESIDEFQDVCRLGNMFLICGTLEAELPFKKVEFVRLMSRKIGLGLTGVHEWMVKRSYKYEMNKELNDWMGKYESSKEDADKFISNLGITPLVKYRAIAPAGTLSILAGTSSGIEPIYSKGVKRRYLNGENWVDEIFVDPTVKYIVENNNLDPESIETAMDLSKDVERRVKFQYDMQKFVDMGISSTINLPKWGSEYNNKETVKDISKIIRRYAHGLRGLTFYADGSRGGQPLEQIPYDYAVKNEGISTDNQIDFMENSSCKSGSCGI